MLSKTLLKQKGMTKSFRMFSAVNEKPDIFMDVKNHGFLPNTKPMLELPQQFSAMN